MLAIVFSSALTAQREVQIPTNLFTRKSNNRDFLIRTDLPLSDDDVDARESQMLDMFKLLISVI